MINFKSHNTQSVVFFVASPFCKRDYERYGIDIFIVNGFDVFVWDVTYALYPHLRNSINVVEPMDWERNLMFTSKKAIITALNNCADKTIVIDPIGYNLNTFRIYRTLSKNKIPYISTPVCSIPPIFFKQTIKNKLQTMCKVFSFRKLANYIIQNLPLSCFGIAPAAMVITEGLKCNIKRPGVTTRTHVIQSHALDYDIFLQLQKNKPSCNIANDRIAVFLDNYLPHHSDTLYSKTRCPVTIDVYYEELRNFFDFLEKAHEIKIVIAAHPRSNYAGCEEQYFGMRPVIRGRTADLVSQANLIVTTFSTSISFAVLYKKPMLFITTNQINDSSDYDYGRYIKEIAHLFGLEPINISSDFSKAQIFFEINEKLYNKYTHDYITINEQEKLSHPQIVCNAIKEYWQLT